MRSYQLPAFMENWIETELQKLGTSLSRTKVLAASIKKMADFYLEHPVAPTPWNELWCRQAQIAYYFPLNFLRNLRVFEELKHLNFFDRGRHWHEFGVGLGPSLEAYHQAEISPKQILSSNLVEQSTFARESLNHRLQRQQRLNPQWLSQLPKSLPPSSLLMMSYSLTELSELPTWFWSAEAIIIVEPSTREDGRQLMTLRDQALNNGFSVIAPCTHALSCPLLKESKRDWCHDRIAFDRPQWMLAIENELPFSNSTLTLSYLALKKSPSSVEEPNVQYNVRVVGDLLDEKGKTRQLICRGDQREFLTFLKKSHAPLTFYRGDLLKIDEPIQKKGEEIRVLPAQVKKKSTP